MSAPVTVEALGLGRVAEQVARRLVSVSRAGGQGWCCTLSLHHPKVGGRGTTMRITEVRRALAAVFGMDPQAVIETRWCDCPNRCRPRLSKSDPRYSGRKVKAYRIAPELWDRITTETRRAA
jgi:hypothetical protein